MMFLKGSLDWLFSVDASQVGGMRGCYADMVSAKFDLLKGVSRLLHLSCDGSFSRRSGGLSLS